MTVPTADLMPFLRALPRRGPQSTQRIDDNGSAGSLADYLEERGDERGRWLRNALAQKYACGCLACVCKHISLDPDEVPQ